MRRRAVLLGTLSLAGCAASVEPRLHSLAPSLVAAGSPVALTVGLEPVDVAAVVARRELVLRPNPTEVMLTADDIWAEPVDTMLQRVLAEDLARGLGLPQVVRLPTRVPTPLDRLVEVQVLDLDGRDGQTARLTAIWRVFAGRPPRAVREGRTEVSEPYAPADDRGALVLALNRAVARLAADVAAAVRATA
jgi:uncharacterized lipoprotein YmbA